MDFDKTLAVLNMLVLNFAFLWGVWYITSTHYKKVCAKELARIKAKLVKAEGELERLRPKQ